MDVIVVYFQFLLFYRWSNALQSLTDRLSQLWCRRNGHHKAGPLLFRQIARVAAIQNAAARLGHVSRYQEAASLLPE